VFGMIVGVGSAASFECDIFFVFLFPSKFAYSMAVASHICITLIIIKPRKQKKHTPNVRGICKPSKRGEFRVRGVLKGLPSSG